jgi:lysophospholipase L1-like esterase
MALAIACVGIVAIAALGDFVLFWWNHSFGDSRTFRDRNVAAVSRSVYIQTPHGLRTRRFIDQSHRDPISGRDVPFRTNALGFRGAPVAATKGGELRILALGDSITLGAYAEESETYPARLEALLRQTLPHAHVINAGVPGLTLNQERAVLAETGLLIDPDVVLVGLYLNDASEVPVYAPEDGLLAGTATGRRLRMMQFNNEMRERNRARYEAMSGRAYPDATYGEEAWRTDRRAFDALVAENAVDWGAAWFEPTWDTLRAELETLANLSRAHRFQAAIVMFPTTYQVEAGFVADEPQRFFEREARALGLAHLDLLPALRDAYQSAGHTLAYDHCHLTPEGNGVAARAIAPWLARIIDAAPPLTTDREQD